MSTTDDLIQSVIDEVGYDAYYVYPDSQRLIPDPVLWGIAAACVIEYIKGLGVFGELGRDTRAQLEETVARWRKKDGFESHLQTLNLQVPLTRALESVARQGIPEDKRRESTTRLEEALKEFGLSEEGAREHASKIAALVDGSVSAP